MLRMIIISWFVKGEHMKIYWTKKSIPELKNLTPGQRKRNFKPPDSIREN